MDSLEPPPTVCLQIQCEDLLLTTSTLESTKRSTRSLNVLRCQSWLEGDHGQYKGTGIGVLRDTGYTGAFHK